MYTITKYMYVIIKYEYYPTPGIGPLPVFNKLGSF